ncbi:FecR family protein [bacterium]|nr:FecR family protein [bacterium]
MIRHVFLTTMIVPALILSLNVPLGFALDFVASIKDIQGQIEVERGPKQLAARNGLILYDQDTVVTGKDSKATIIFRDGSTIRLFSNTRFLIEKSVESKQESRRFLYNIFLKVGSFWGKFTKKYQSTTIRTPTATAGIKGTVVAMSQRNDGLTVSLTSGAVTIENDDETVNLQPGQIVRGVTRLGSIKNKIKNLNYHLVFEADKKAIDIPDTGEEIELFFTLQMVQTNTNENAFRTGPVYISHEFDNIRFDTDINLNERGYARIKATVKPFQEKDNIQQSIQLTAIMDGEAFIDVDAGQVFLTFSQAGQKPKTLMIDVNSDTIE